MVETSQPTASKYEEARYLVETVGLSIVKACSKVDLNINTYYLHRKKSMGSSKKEAGASDQAAGTTRTETPGANPHKDTPASLAHTKEQ